MRKKLEKKLIGLKHDDWNERKKITDATPMVNAKRTSEY